MLYFKDIFKTDREMFLLINVIIITTKYTFIISINIRTILANNEFLIKIKLKNYITFNLVT